MHTRRLRVLSMILLGIAGAAAPAHAATFAARTDFVTGAGPTGVASADLNRDGILDLAVANLQADTVSVLLGNDAGSFATAIHYATGDGPLAVAIADLDADGTLDVVTANSAANTVSVLLGVGDGTLGAKTEFATGSMPAGIAIADMDANGDLDLLTVNGTAGTVSVLPGSGSGTFGAHLPYATGSFPQALAVGDFDLDGSLDVATANYGTNTVSILLGTGTGSLGAKSDFATGASPTAIAAGDLDSDGVLDLVTANFSADSSVTVLLGSGSGSFAIDAHHATPSAPSGVTLADVDGDGKLDAIAANYSDNSVSVFSGDGTGALGLRMDFATGVVAFATGTGDFDRDGRVDIVSTNMSSGSVSVLLNTTAIAPAGNFGPRADFPLSANLLMPRSLVLADFNRDGILDAATANVVGHSISIVPGTGGGAFGTSTQYGTGTGTAPYEVRAGDLNHDGHLDLVATNSADGVNTVGVLLANGMGGYGPGTTQYATGNKPKGLALADLDRDGNLDIVTTNYVDHTVSILLGTGTGTFGTKTDFPTASFPVDVAIADLDHDGTLDLVTANMGVNRCVSVLAGNGDGTLALRADVPLSEDVVPQAIVISDVNRDGNEDLLTANGGGQNVSVFLGDGTGGFASSVQYPAAPDGLTVGDLNRDAIPDLVATSFANYLVKPVFGRGDGAFGSAMSRSIASTLYAAEVADLDRDGRPDIVAADYSGSRLCVFLNVTPQTGDLSVALSADPPTVAAGTPLTITAVVTNGGPGNVEAVTLNGALFGLAFVSGISSRATRCVGTSAPTCSIGPLSSGASVTVTIEATIAATGGSVFDARITGIAVDPAETNNHATIVRTAFTDDPLLAGMTVKAAHLTELRKAIDIHRMVAGVPPVAYTTDAAITPTATRIKAAHLNEACAALKAAHPTAACSPIAAGLTISTSGFTSLRSAVRALE